MTIARAAWHIGGMARDDRLFDLIQILRDGALHTAADLGARLGVSTRTIWRDMATLADSGLPVEGERGVGYVLRAPVNLPPLAVTRDEFEALRLGLALVTSGQDATLRRAASNLRAKISAVTPLALTDTGADSFVFTGPAAAQAAAHIGPLRRAIRDHLVVVVTRRDGATDRIRPLHLGFWGTYWTLVGWSEKTNTFKHLRVDLIASVEVEGAGFLSGPGETLDDWITGQTGA